MSYWLPGYSRRECALSGINAPLFHSPDMIVMRSAHFKKGCEERQAGFRALIFVDAVCMQAVAAPPGSGIIERLPRLIFTDEPIEGPPRPLSPNRVAGAVLRFEARGNHRASL